MHAKRDGKDFERKIYMNILIYMLKTNILLLADIFENFQNMPLKIYELDPAQFFIAPRLS